MRFIIGIIIFCVANLAFTDIGGTPDGYAGDPLRGGMDCGRCHFGATGGECWLQDFPTEYIPGTVYDFSLHITHPTARSWGFQMFVGTSTGTRAGTLVATDATHTFVSSRGYMNQNLAGAYRGTSGGVVYNARWIAPTTDMGTIIAFVSATPCDNRDNEGGDAVITFQQPITYSTRVVENMEKPVLRSSIVDFFDISGKFVARANVLNARNVLSQGVYFYRPTDGAALKKLVIVK